MWAFLGKIFARSKTLNAALGDVVFETPEVRGQYSGSFLQWRVKRGINGSGYFVGLRMSPDASAGVDGAMKNFMNFDIESAQRLRSELDRCIDEYYKLARDAPRHSTSVAE